MSKNGIEIENLHTMLSESKKWSICVGAGINKGIMPDWFELVDRLIKQKCEPEMRINIEDFKSIGFSADAMLQAIKNNLKMTDGEFIKTLSLILYENIYERLNVEEKNIFTKLFDRNSQDVIGHKVEIVTSIIEKCFNGLTVNQIADVVTDAMNCGNNPYEILTFNGDDILYMLMCYYSFLKTKSQKNCVKTLYNSLSGFETKTTYIVHCHGIIIPPRTKRKRGLIADDKLVFAEESYLELSNSVSSFQANHFISACMNSCIVFIGVSLTDTNMRKWLSWVHKMKINDLKENDIDSSSCTEHYWINVKTDKVKMKWIEESVSHLGVRLIWINSWSEVNTALRKMLVIKEK